jgi:anti-anti-sigma factor
MGLMENNKAQAKNMQEYIECRRSDNNAISLKGRINSFNAPMVEKALNDLCKETQDVILDCEELEYTASSGLRIFLAMSKKHRMTLVNVQPAVYEVLELSGLTSIMDVHKAFRIVSLEGCEVIGEGANGIVYRGCVKMCSGKSCKKACFDRLGICDDNRLYRTEHTQIQNALEHLKTQQNAFSE